jgi:protein dithiol oxidoreductase (disulfide-forming)
VKRIALLTAALLITAGCGQSEDTTTAAVSASQPTAAETQSSAPAASETQVAQAPATQTQAPAEARNAAGAVALPAVNEGAPAAAQVDLSAVEAAGFVEGTNYTRLSPAQGTSSSPDQVEVAEFFMYSCIHCYNLEPYVQDWLPKKPAYINFIRIPTTWDPLRRLHAQAFYTAQVLGKGEEMHWPFFREMHENGNYLQTPEAMAEFFGRFGVSHDEFESVFNSFGVANMVNRADELGRRYRVDATPTIVINGKYTTGTGMADPVNADPAKLFQLIELLSAAELGR